MAASSIAERKGKDKTAAFLKSMEKMQESMGADIFKAFLKSFGECTAG
jgi:hypothetical protein